VRDAQTRVSEPFPILDLAITLGESVRQDETMGTKRKEWLVNVSTKEEALLKFARPGTGEDWSEKVAHEIAALLGVPCPPRLELAIHKGAHAVLSWSFLQKGQSLIHGNELLSQVDESYPQHEFYRVPEHRISTVERILRDFTAPANAPSERTWRDGFDVFAGYLMLDALIGNTDRHHQNWGVVLDRGLAGVARQAWLSPTYDHASSLGRELSDTKRKNRIDAPVGRADLTAYAEKATSALYDDTGRKLAPIEAFGQCALLRREAFEWWQERLRMVGVEEMRALVERVPESRLGAVGKKFAQELLRYNFDRLTRLTP
jgi:hypothetical protein